MSRWFRHYAGMMRDEKLVSAAVKSKQPVERVVWVWGAILESASEINDNGRYEFDAGEAAYFLRCDDTDLVSILACLESLGRLSGGMVVRWGDRQYSSDSAAERQRRYRERKSGNAPVHGNGGDDKRNGDATVTSRDGVVTPQETDTEEETERKIAPLTPLSGGDEGEFEEKVWQVFPRHLNSTRLDALTAWWRLEPQDRLACIGGCTAYRRQHDAEVAAGRKPIPKKLSTWIAKRGWEAFAAAETAADGIVVIGPGDPEFGLVQAFFGTKLVLSKSGKATVRTADLEEARRAAA